MRIDKLKIQKEVYFGAKIHAWIFVIKNVLLFAIMKNRQLKESENHQLAQKLQRIIFVCMSINFAIFLILTTSLYATDIVQYNSVFYVVCLYQFSMFTGLDTIKDYKKLGLSINWPGIVLAIILGQGELIFAKLYQKVLAPLSMKKYLKLSSDSKIIEAYMVRQELLSVQKIIGTSLFYLGIAKWLDPFYDSFLSANMIIFIFGMILFVIIGWQRKSKSKIARFLVFFIASFSNILLLITIILKRKYFENNFLVKFFVNLEIFDTTANFIHELLILYYSFLIKLTYRDYILLESGLDEIKQVNCVEEVQQFHI